MLQLRRSPERQLLVFRLAGLACALPLADVQEVVPMAQLSSPPGLPKILDRFLNLRGQLIPVVRLDCWFGFPPKQPDRQTSLLIVHSDDGVLGLCVDSVREVISRGRQTVARLQAET